MHKIIFRCQGVHEVKEVGNHWLNMKYLYYEHIFWSPGGSQ